MEKFWSIPCGKNKVGLYSYHNRYLSAQPNGSLQQAKLLKGWETFEVTKENDQIAFRGQFESLSAQKDANDLFAFRSYHGYLSAQKDGAIEVNVKRKRAWEQFRVTVIEYDIQ